MGHRKVIRSGELSDPFDRVRVGAEALLVLVVAEMLTFRGWLGGVQRYERLQLICVRAALHADRHLEPLVGVRRPKQARAGYWVAITARKWDTR
jgi:hypothetical protein